MMFYKRAGCSSEKLQMQELGWYLINSIEIYMYICICIKLRNHINSIIMKMYTLVDYMDFCCI